MATSAKKDWRVLRFLRPLARDGGPWAPRWHLAGASGGSERLVRPKKQRQRILPGARKK
jgi:hypothetical protein